MSVTLKRLLLLLVFVLPGSLIIVNAQQDEKIKSLKLTGEESINLKGNENITIVKAPQEVPAEVPDTNFTYEKYGQFLLNVSDTSKYLVLPIDEFRKRVDTNKIIIGLRHDIDNDLNKAKHFSVTEKNLGVKSTYYILHTADYYLANPSDKSLHTEAILPVLKDMQDNSGFEIGWHNDLVTLQVVYKIDPVIFLQQELTWLRNNGIIIKGSASHGSNYCRVYWYLNFYFFEECTWPAVGQYINNVTIPSGSSTIPIKKGKFSDFGLEYEAYFLKNNKYYSDASFVNGKRWDIGMLDLSTLKKGDRVIILLHPIHWHQASVLADFKTFSLANQKSCTINTQDATVNVVMPYSYDRANLVPGFTLSPGAYAKVSGSVQTSGNSKHDFIDPVIYTVYAEHRSITKNWTVRVENEKNTACSIESFIIPGYTKRVIMDQSKKTILLRVYSSAKVDVLPVQFRLSDGASAWIGSIQQFSNTGTTDFSQPVIYKIVAEDGVTTSQWKVTVEILNDKADIVSFVVPGMSKSAIIDPTNKTVAIEIKFGEPLKDIPALFQLSYNAKAFVNGSEQISGLTLNTYTQPVIYRIVSEDSLTFNNWTVTASYGTLLAESTGQLTPSLRIYPNPVYDKALIELQNISAPEARIEIFNSLGKRVYSSAVRNVISYSEDIDFSGYAPGIYFVKCSSVKDPVTFIVARH